MKYLINALASLVIASAVMLFALNAPAQWFQVWHPQQLFGSAFTTLVGANQLSAFPTTYNNNLNITANTSAANTFSGLQTLSGGFVSQASSTVVGGLNADTLALKTSLSVVNGGTGSTTLSQYAVLIGNATGGLLTPSNGLGTSGQILTSNGAGVAPSFQSATVNQTLAYTWTGLHTFNTSGIIDNASSTFTSVLNLNGSTYLNGILATHEFGGNGANGALSLSSGTTTINLGNAAYTELDYTSVSITSNGHLAFSNPNTHGSFIVIRSQGNVTLTCSPAPCIDISSLGAAGGAGGGSGATSGAAGNNGNPFWLFNTFGGSPGLSSGGTPSGGGLPTAIVPTMPDATSTLMRYGGQFWVGGGGGGGGAGNAANNAAQGNGGNGGGGLLIEVGGFWNFTTAGGIYATGATGTAPTNTTYGGAGGGGAGGNVLVEYSSLTANSGTINVMGGGGGTGGSNAAASCGAGGATAYTVGNSGATGASCVGGSAPSGVSTVVQNTNFF